ncbi:MAG: TadE/TadG family type IV pilus assembly protein [Hespellia sp.]|nr:TadE/TadG family type IV pilus assembly protein [Hespellia sp.]
MSNRRNKTMVRGVATVEMAYIMPVVFLVFLVIVYTSFYYHDKNILIGEVSEAAVVAAQKQRTLKGLDAEAVAGHFQNRAEHKVIMMSGVSLSVTESGNYIVAAANASHGRMRLEIEKKATKMENEKYIRLLRKADLRE